MLARAFLRLTVLEALRPSAYLNPTQQMLDAWLADWEARGGVGTIAPTPYPTLAAQYVSDSRIDPIDDVEQDERRPLIGVYTEGTELTKIAQAGPQFHKGEVEVVFETSVVSKFAVDGGNTVIDFADTDAATEAQLDLIEDQIYWCLHFGPTGNLFRQMSKLPFDHWHSEPHRSGEEGIKLAKRTIKGRIRMKEVCYEAVPSSPPADLARLPPALQTIAAGLGNSSYLADLALGLARGASVMPTRVDLKTVTVASTIAPNPNTQGAPSISATLSNLQGS